jgi:hypothetical protein
MEYKTRLMDIGRDSDMVNRHFSILRCALNLSKARLSKQQPDWKNLFSADTENPEHVKMIDDTVYPKLAAEAAKVGTWCRTLLELGCEFGWRKNVWLNLKVKDVDMLNCKITLPGVLSKNKEPYVAYFVRAAICTICCRRASSARGRMISCSRERTASLSATSVRYGSLLLARPA